MSEKEREEEPEDQEQEEQPEITVDVTIHGHYIGAIRLKRGATLEDLIEELRRLGHLPDLAGFMIMLDGRMIRIDPKTGKLSENPILARSATLSLLKKVVGG